ncbi:type II toxin-antitoxin system PemK/MazF family toxin [Bengtsoniella intestinalis]|uniref:type II toxin-antitoxin system PemK/MazF family toxin n=1 Tax=Bengtsoniella intestinalis TaxID=3073143 RepID=UPI00391FBF12
MNQNDQSYRRGELYYADLGHFRGSEQSGVRPVLVLQNNIGNIYCPTLIVAPLTSKYNKKRNQPTHCELHHVSGLSERSTVMLEQIATIDKHRVSRYIGEISPEDMRNVEEAIYVSLGLTIPYEVEAP